MRTAVATTSLQAFDSLSPITLQRKEAEVLAVFKSATNLTREQLAQRLNWKEASVCGRVNSLVTKGVLAEFDGGKTASGRSAKVLRLAPSQLSMFASFAGQVTQ
jgi:predicted ArsR family transcriptional regulator